MKLAIGQTIVVRAAMLEAAAIEKQRKTFLQLMKAVEQIKTFKEAKTVQNAIMKFTDDYDNLVYKNILPHVDDAFDNPDTVAMWKKDLKEKCWALVTIGFPLWEVDKYHTEDEVLNRFLNKRKSYLADARKKARIAWNVLQDYIKAAAAPTMKVIPETQEDVHGFSVTWIGDFERDKAQAFAEALKIYKERAQKVLPMLLSHKMPMRVSFKSDNIDQGGSYEHRFINISLFWNNKPQESVHIIAHEHGHHVYENYLSAADQKYWETAVYGSYGPIKLSEIIKKWPDKIKDRGVWNVDDFYRESDPVFSLQMAILTGGYQAGRGGQPLITFDTREEAENLLATEGDKAYPVPKFPISAYASKNSDEAFCETLGLLVAYGSRAVHPMALVWLKTIIPTITVAKTRE